MLLTRATSASVRIASRAFFKSGGCCRSACAAIICKARRDSVRSPPPHRGRTRHARPPLPGSAPRQMRPYGGPPRAWKRHIVTLRRGLADDGRLNSGSVIVAADGTGLWQLNASYPQFRGSSGGTQVRLNGTPRGCRLVSPIGSALSVKVGPNLVCPKCAQRSASSGNQREFGNSEVQ